MPIYEYQCSECGKIFEELILSKSDLEGITCKACGSQRVEKVLSGSAVVMGPSATAASCPEFRSGACHGGGCGCGGH